MNLLRVLFLSTLCMAPAESALAKWSANIGYHNPASATLGLNLMHLWQEVAFEVGLGHASIDTSDSDQDSDDDENDNAGIRAIGGFSFKYLFNSGVFRPYVQAGMSLGVGGTIGQDSGAGTGASGPYGGGGIFLYGNPIYVYASYNLASEDNRFWQGGVGMDL